MAKPPSAAFLTGRGLDSKEGGLTWPFTMSRYFPFSVVQTRTKLKPAIVFIIAGRHRCRIKLQDRSEIADMHHSHIWTFASGHTPLVPAGAQPTVACRSDIAYLLHFTHIASWIMNHDAASEIRPLSAASARKPSSAPVNYSGDAAPPGKEALLSVRESLAGSVVFITGVTGYLGSLVLEQLLRTCPGEREGEGDVRGASEAGAESASGGVRGFT